MNRTVCEHEFVTPDPKNPNYSMTEFDLPARLNKTIRKDLRNNRYEIIDINTGEVSHARPTLKEIVRVANQLGDRIRIECDSLCPSSDERQPTRKVMR